MERQANFFLPFIPRPGHSNIIKCPGTWFLKEGYLYQYERFESSEW